MPEDTFVGRQEQIDRFKQLLAAPPGKPYILHLQGPGGIGKSKILLEYRKICEQLAMPHTQIIDFYDGDLRARTSLVEQKIIVDLAPWTDVSDFRHYQQRFEQFEENREDASLGPQLRQQFIEDLTQFTQKAENTGKRVILLFDTIELIKDNLMRNRLVNSWLPQLEKAIVVLSGRPEAGIISTTPQPSDAVFTLKVKEFIREEAVEYLIAREVWPVIEEDGVVEELFALTNKRPLLLALSADWIFEHVSFAGTKPTDLVSGTDRDDFERKLVQDLPRTDKVHEPERTILPAMAHIPRPFDAELLRFLYADIAQGEEESILRRLSELSFIKDLTETTPSGKKRTFYWFQDELRALFHKHIFEADVHIDTWQPIRNDISRRMLEFYDERIAQAQQAGDHRSVQSYIANRLYHELYLDPGGAFKEFEDLFENAQNLTQTGYAAILLETIRSFFNLLEDEQRFKFQLMEVSWLRDIGNAQVALESAQRLLANFPDAENQDDPQIIETLADIYNAVGFSAEQLGDLSKALEYYGRSLELRERFNLLGQFREHLNIGRVYRARGDWEKSIWHCRRAHDLAPTNNKNDWGWLASILRDLGYTFALQGQYDEGLNYCNQAIEIWTKLQAPSRIGIGQRFRGSIYRMAGQYEDAEQDLEAALRTIDPFFHLVRVQTYSELGFNFWFRYNATQNESFLDKAQAILETGVAEAREYNLRQELPHILHRLGHVYWDQGKKEKARQVNEEGYIIAKEVSNIYFAIQGLLGKAEFAFDDELDNKLEIITEHARELAKDFESNTDVRFPLLYGRMRRILGDVLFGQKNYEDAFHYYADGLDLISQHGGYGKYQLGQELEHLESHLRSLTAFTSIEEILKYCNILKQTWTDRERQNPALIRLIAWITRLITDINFQSQH